MFSYTLFKIDSIFEMCIFTCVHKCVCVQLKISFST